MCCYGCGLEGKFSFKSKQSPYFGQMRCSKNYRSCPVQAIKGGHARLGQKHSAETKAKIGAASRGRSSPFKGKTSHQDPRILAGDRHPAFGKKFSDSHRKKISEGRKGIALTEDRKLEISRQMTGSGNPRYGKGHSDEQTAKWRATIEKNQSLIGPNNPNWNPNLDRDGMKAYRSAVMRKTRKVVKENNLTAGLTLGRIDGGYEVDHRVPISVCFAEGVSIERAASLTNLQVLPWKDNLSKRDKNYPNELLLELKL